MLRPGETHLEFWVQLCALQYKTHGHTRATPAQGHKDDGLQHLAYKEWLTELELFSLEKKSLRRILSMCINTHQEELKKVKLNSFQWCPVARQETKNTN